MAVLQWDFDWNFDLLDLYLFQMAALQWVVENIEQFGGDPSRLVPNWIKAEI